MSIDLEDEDSDTQHCDYCGFAYNGEAEGHQHDSGCECEYCEAEDERFMGYSFCSPECEMHFGQELLCKTVERSLCIAGETG